MYNAAPLQHRMIATSHGRISVKVRAGSGPALVLLHGNSFSGDVFARLLNAKALNGIPLIIPDLPGHGKSGNAIDPGKTYHFSGFANCITEVTAALNVENYVVFGWSLGGQIAIEMLDAATGLIGVAACGSAIVQRGPLGLMAGFHFSRALLLAGKSVMNPKDAQIFASLCFGKTAERAMVETILRVDPALRPNLSRAAILGKGRDQRLAVATTQTPVCLMLGENDPFVRADSLARIIGASLFHGGAEIIKGSGHAPFIDAPDIFDSILAEFYANAVKRAVLNPRIAEPLKLAS